MISQKLDITPEEDVIGQIQSLFPKATLEERAIGREMVVLALEGGDMNASQMSARFRETEVSGVVREDVLKPAFLASIARKTRGLVLRGYKIGINPDALPEIAAREESRMRTLLAVRDALGTEGGRLLLTKAAIAGAVRSLAQRCMASDALDLTEVPSMGLDERVVATMGLDRVFGTRPQLEALLALVAAGGSADLSLIQDVAATMSSARLPRHPKYLFSYPAEIGIVDVDSQRVNVNGDINRFLHDGITAIRGLLMPLRHYLKQVKEQEDVPFALEPEHAPPTVDVVDSNQVIVTPAISQKEDPMADWYRRRQLNRDRRLNRWKKKSSRKSRRKKHYSDSEDDGVPEDPRARTIHATEDARQSSNFDIAKDNPEYVESMARLWVQHKGGSIEAARESVREKLSATSVIQGSSSASGLSPTVPVRTEPIHIPTRRFSTLDEQAVSARARPMDIVVTDVLLERGREELLRMQQILLRCLTSTNSMKQAEFSAWFGPHLFHAAQCIADVQAILEKELFTDPLRLSVAQTVANYGLHALSEYVTVAAMNKNSEVSWDDLPLSRSNPVHREYVVALAREITDRARAVKNISADDVRDIACAAFFGEHNSSDVNMSFGSHIHSLSKDTTEPIEDDIERSRGLCIHDYIIRYGDADGYVPLNTKDWLPTNAPPGSSEKCDALRHRVEIGQPLYHEDDRVDLTGIHLSSFSEVHRRELQDRENELEEREISECRSAEALRRKREGKRGARKNMPVKTEKTEADEEEGVGEKPAQ